MDDTEKTAHCEVDDVWMTEERGRLHAVKSGHVVRLGQQRPPAPAPRHAPINIDADPQNADWIKTRR